jgi:predicted O-methyltransferase YrrM
MTVFSKWARSVFSKKRRTRVAPEQILNGKHYHQARPQLKTSDSARQVVDATWPLTSSGIGNIAPDDGYFLLSLLEQSNASKVLEIGVASGTSSLMILRMLEGMSPAASLVSVDLQSRYFHDPSKPVGFMVQAHYERPPAHWTLLTKVAAMTFADDAALRDENQHRRYDFVFIDAHHGHPWPTLDALCLLPFTLPGSWVAFHDVNLPLLGDYPWYGAVYVVREWPLDVVIGAEGQIPNIGAIRLSDAGEDDAARLIANLSLPWDCGIDSQFQERILAHLGPFVSPAQLQVVTDSFERNARLPS